MTFYKKITNGRATCLAHWHEMIHIGLFSSIGAGVGAMHSGMRQFLKEGN